jgi:hypothetical protein
MNVVSEQTTLERIHVAVEEAARNNKPLIEFVLTTPEEVLSLKKEVWMFLPKKYLMNAELPPGFKLYNIPVRIEIAVIAADRGKTEESPRCIS